MNRHTHCSRARLHWMAWKDGESDEPSETERQHLSSCGPCQAWLERLASVGDGLRGLSYPDVLADLWPRIEQRIQQPDQRPVLGRLVFIGALVLGWRALQLVFDLPLPVLHPLVPLFAVVVGLWRVVGDPLAIETAAPELRKEASDGIA